MGFEPDGGPRGGSEETLTLPDGRRLGWASYGDPQGRPMVALHGTPDSRIIWKLADGPARELGVRIIAPDRPGFGLSDPAPGRTVLDWVADQSALAAYLSLDRYPLIAVSGGSAYAAAFAWAKPVAVSRLGLFACISPLGASGVLEGCNRRVGAAFRLARWAPRLLTPLAGLMVRTARRNPGAVERALVRTRPPADREVIARPEVHAVLRENLPEQFKDGRSIAREMRLAAGDWGFRLEEITVPTRIWQGGLDDVHTPAMARHLATRIRHAELVLEPGYATFNWLDVMGDMLSWLVEPVGGRD